MSVLFTVGYEGTDLRRFIETLQAAGVEQIADVRAVPISRKPGFSKTKLNEHLAAAGIGYRHFAALGDPKEGREAAKAGNYVAFRRIFGNHLISSSAQAELQSLGSFASQYATALLCFERSPNECHRSIIADSLKVRVGFQVFDLFADDPQKYVRNAAKVPRFNRILLAAE